jgi:hypothetical protein
MENNFDKRHFEDMDRLSQRLDTIQSKSSKADMWQKIKKGFDKVKNSSVGGIVASLVGVGATMVYGAHVNDGMINMDLATPLMTSVVLGYASVAAFIGSHTASKNIERKVSALSNDLDKDSTHLKSDTLGLLKDINESGKYNGISEKKADRINDLYDKVFSKSLNTPLEKEKDTQSEKRKKNTFGFS